MKTLNKIAFLFATCIASTVHADDYTIQGAWQDATPTGAEYVAQYNAQCRVDSVLVYEDLALPGTGFSTPLIFDPGQLLECRVRNVNVVVPSTPIYGNWSAWVQGAIATAPVDPNTIILIQIHQIP